MSLCQDQGELMCTLFALWCTMKKEWHPWVLVQFEACFKGQHCELPRTSKHKNQTSNGTNGANEPRFQVNICAPQGNSEEGTVPATPYTFGIIYHIFRTSVQMHITLFSFSAASDCTCKHDQTKLLLISGLPFHALPAIICCIFSTHIIAFIIMNIFLCSNDKSENISRLPRNLWGHFSIFFTCQSSIRWTALSPFTEISPSSPKPRPIIHSTMATLESLESRHEEVA